MAKGAPEPQQQGGGGGDRSSIFLWLIVLIVAVTLAVWYFGQLYIAMIVFKVKLYEIYAIDLVLHYWAVLPSALHLSFVCSTSRFTAFTVLGNLHQYKLLERQLLSMFWKR